MSLALPWRDPVVDLKTGRVTRLWQAFFNAVADQQAIQPWDARSVSATAQAASVAATAFPGVTLAPGLYRLSYVVQVTTAAGVSSSLTVRFAWTSQGEACSFSGSALISNDPAAPQSGTLVVNVDGGTDVTYAVDYVSNPAAAMAYAFTVALEALPANGTA